MTRPVALRDVAGRIWAYACGACRHVASGTSLLDWPDGEGPHLALVEHSLEQAERCCRCYHCKRPYERRVLRSSCLSCAAWTTFTSGWLSIWTVASRNYTEAQYQAWLREVDDD